jgi:hypothetical protein
MEVFMNSEQITICKEATVVCITVLSLIRLDGLEEATTKLSQGSRYFIGDSKRVLPE